MKKEMISRTALKVAFTTIAPGNQKQMRTILPDGIVDAIRKLLILSGAVSSFTIRTAEKNSIVHVKSFSAADRIF